MYTGAAQGDATTTAVNVVIMSRIKQHRFLNVKYTFNKSCRKINRIQRAFTCDKHMSDVRLCCAVYLLIPAIPATSCTVRR